MKLSIIKPILWNRIGYVAPSGDGATSGFPFDHGFGHEEWNNDPKWNWQGYRVFHTESSKQLLQFSETGNLGMLMIASHDNRQYAVGVAAGVFNNTKEDMELIAADLNLYDNWRQLWQLNLVRVKHKHNESGFRSFWQKDCKWVQWKVDPAMYHWFEKPILLDPLELTGKKKLLTMFGRFQPILPNRVASLIRHHVPRTKNKIIAWFEEGVFNKLNDASKSPRKKKTLKSSTPTSLIVRYWVYGERVAEPCHARLQSQYVAFLRSQDLVPQENIEGVDLRYLQDRKCVFVEVKPTEKMPPKFAIRGAIGQLLEYQHALNQSAVLEIVINTKPHAAQVDLLKSLGIRLWLNNGMTFIRLA